VAFAQLESQEPNILYKGKNTGKKEDKRMNEREIKNTLIKRAEIYGIMIERTLKSVRIKQINK
jgi:hypothetical protein